MSSGFVLDLPIPSEDGPVVIDHPLVGDDFETLCEKNPDLRIEQDRHGKIVVMPPVNPTSGHYELELGAQLHHWARQTDSGLAFSSSTIFTLPNGAKRSPDASWLPHDAWDALSAKEQQTFSRICPHFVIELRSPSDRLPPLQEKMAEYLENGARLGFLVDPKEAKVHVYRPETEIVVLEKPLEVSGEPELPGLVIQLDRIW